MLLLISFDGWYVRYSVVVIQARKCVYDIRLALAPARLLRSASADIWSTGLCVVGLLR